MNITAHNRIFKSKESLQYVRIKVVTEDAPCDLCPSPLRDNARSLQPRSGPDHPRVCLPGSDGGPVLFRGPAHKGQEQTQAQETPNQTAHVPPAAAAADDDWEKPHSLTGTATLNCCWSAGFTSKTETLLKGQLVLSSDIGGVELHGV